MNTSNSRKRLIVKCPQCAKSIDWESVPFRPFCSKRCQILDQAAWADGKYQIPLQPDVSDSSHSIVQSKGWESSYSIVQSKGWKPSEEKS